MSLREPYLVGFIEESLYSLRQPSDQTEGVAQHVQPQHQHIHLFDSLINTHPHTTLGRQELSRVRYYVKEETFDEIKSFSPGQLLIYQFYQFLA